MSREQTRGVGWLVACIVGIFVCYLQYGLVQESITHREFKDGEKVERFKFTIFQLFIQCLFSTIFAGVALFVVPGHAKTGFQDWSWFSRHIFGGKKGKDVKQETIGVPPPQYMQVSMCYVFAMYTSNVALQYIPYPMQVIVKSSKMIPVMLVGLIWYRRRFSRDETVRVLMVTLGVIMFSYKPDAAASEHENSIRGLLLALFSLFLDGFVGPAQEHIEHVYKASVHQLMFFSNVYALFVTGALLVFTGEGVSAISFCERHPELLRLLFYFAALSAAGQNFVFFLVRNYSALTLVTVTTTRKLFTVLFSILFGRDGKGHSLSNLQWSSVVIVFVGLIWEQVVKSKKQSPKAHKK